MGHLADMIRDFQGGGFRILMYHSISECSRYPFSLSPREFAWQMAWLRREGVLVQSLAEALQTQKSAVPRVVITFDDGYEDNFTNALPILSEYGYKATFFVVTAFVGKNNGWEEEGKDTVFRLMDWEQLDLLVRRGHSVGGHTHTHVNLLETGRERAGQELRLCWEQLRRNLSQDFVPFAYPYGGCTSPAIDCLRKIGYSCAVVAGGFWGNNASSDRWRLRREDINQATGRRGFMARVRGARDLRYLGLGFNYLVQGAIKKD